MEVRALRIDKSVLGDMRTVSEKWLLDDAVAALVAAEDDDFVQVHPDIPEPTILRVSDRATRALCDLPVDATRATEEAIARLKANGKRLFSLTPELSGGPRAGCDSPWSRGVGHHRTGASPFDRLKPTVREAWSRALEPFVATAKKER